MILEVMGRDAGHIALNAGIAGGADVILIPEIPYSIKELLIILIKLGAKEKSCSYCCCRSSKKRRWKKSNC